MAKYIMIKWRYLNLLYFKLNLTGREMIIKLKLKTGREMTGVLKNAE